MIRSIYSHLSICILVFIFTTPIVAQKNTVSLTQTIRGIVTDVASGHPIPYATITLPDYPGTGTTTDENGKFTLTQIPIGRHTIQASFMGYEPTLFREILVTSAKETYLEIPMKESVTELTEVFVRPQVNKEKSLNAMALSGARMLSVEEASRYAGGMDDPARLASSFAGVASSVSDNGISIHGNAPHLLQWKMEDVEIPNPNHFADIATLGGGIFSSLSSHVLGNSDFFTGAFPAEYGNAVSGVFDMKMRNGNNQKYENTFQVGILGIDFASEGPLSKNSKASYIFNYRYSTTGLLGDLGIVDLGGTFKYQDLNFKLNFPTKRAGTFSVWSTSLIDNYKNDFEEDTDEWKYNSDRSKGNTKQYMTAGGVGHRYFFSNDSYLKTTLATTFSRQDANQDMVDYDLTITPEIRMDTENTNLIFNTYYNQKINSRITARAGLTYTKMFYDMNLKLAPHEGTPLETISEGKGNSDLISSYISTSTELGRKWTMNLGLYGQFLTLNNQWALEPRMGIKWQTTSRTSLAFSYGMHSRMEKVDVYFVKTPETGNKLVNKNLDFTKAHHVMLSFSHKLADDLHLKVEPYFQYLYDVPVIADSSYSVLNRDVFYVESALVNKGKGYNYGVDITLEKYLAKGMYYMFTGSLFNSRYAGGDGKWHNTKFNRRYILNLLGGKEWMLGKHKQNIFSINLKLTLQGGDRYSPIDEEATRQDPDQIVQYDENQAYSRQYSPMFLTNLTASYKINKKKISHEFAVKLLNLTGCKEHYGHELNMKTGKIDASRQTTSIPSISYKIEF